MTRFFSTNRPSLGSIGFPHTLQAIGFGFSKNTLTSMKHYESLPFEPYYDIHPLRGGPISSSLATKSRGRLSTKCILLDQIADYGLPVSLGQEGIRAASRQCVVTGSYTPIVRAVPEPCCEWRHVSCPCLLTIGLDPEN